MSKLVSCIINELETSKDVNDDFSVFLILLNIDDSGGIQSTASIEPIGNVDIDTYTEECLFFTKQGEKALSVSKAYAAICGMSPSFALVASEKQHFESTKVRIDNPVIGFGENVDEKRFYIACKA